MSDPSSSHYDREYFGWQSEVGEFGGWANRIKFVEYVEPSMAVLDFGCGGGYLLKGLTCRERIGVEVNPEAAKIARANGVTVFPSPRDIESASIDLIVSNHALEHVDYPLGELAELFRVLKPGARVVCVVPCETVAMRYAPGDVNQHLHSWSPLSLGNLFTRAGFEIVESRPFTYKWPPGYRRIARCGRPVFDLACRIYGRLDRRYGQVRLVARKS